MDRCVQKVFSNEKAPLRKNLEKIIELRNTSTHFITEEYEAEGVRIIKELKDPNETHKYSLKTCLEEVNKRLSRNGIVVYFNGNQVKINNYHFRLMNDYFKIKENEKFCYGGWWGQAPLNFYKIINLDIRTIEIVY